MEFRCPRYHMKKAQRLNGAAQSRDQGYLTGDPCGPGGVGSYGALNARRRVAAGRAVGVVDGGEAPLSHTAPLRHRRTGGAPLPMRVTRLGAATIANGQRHRQAELPPPPLLHLEGVTPPPPPPGAPQCTPSPSSRWLCRCVRLPRPRVPPRRCCHQQQKKKYILTVGHCVERQPTHRAPAGPPHTPAAAPPGGPRPHTTRLRRLSTAAAKTSTSAPAWAHEGTLTGKHTRHDTGAGAWKTRLGQASARGEL